MLEWKYNQFGGTITFEDGRTAFLQGEEAAELDDRIEECDTDEQAQGILMEYDHIAEPCEHEPAPRCVPALGPDPLPTCCKCGVVYMPDIDDDEES